MIKPGDKKTTKQNSFTVEELNEHIKNSIIDFVEDFTSPENKQKEVTFRKTTIQVKTGNRLKKLPMVITTTAHKREDGVVRDLIFRIINLDSTKNK